MRLALLLAGSIWAGAAQASECPQRITPDAFRSRVEAVREPVAFADPEARKEVDVLVRMLEGCVNGPIRREDIAALFLARGAIEILSGAPTEWHIKLARDHLTWAYVVGSRDAWEPIYGPQVEEIFDEVSGHLLTKGVLDLSFRQAPEALVVDGDLVQGGRRWVTAGAHVVQWKDSDGWHGELVKLAAEETRVIGGGRASRERSLLPSGGAKESTYRIKWGPQPTGYLGASGRFGVDFDRVGHETGALQGGHLFPELRLDGHLLIYRWLSLRLNVVGGLGVDGARPPTERNAGLSLGVGQKKDDVRWDVTVGPEYKSVPRAISQLRGENDNLRPVFQTDAAVAGGLRAQVQLSELQLDAHVSVVPLPVSGDLGLGFDTGARYRLGENALSPVVGASMGRFSRPGASIEPDVYRWFVVEGGVQWSY
ncbi:MAG: hypothetical protein VX519_10960 [Myxococcota bacterium]|nr:hypothetical protein [Myxococcota bacterium]